MKLKNTTEYPDYFLRRMVSWVCKEIGMPVRTLKHAKFHNSSARWSGRGGFGKFRVGTDPKATYPYEATIRRNQQIKHRDRTECVVWVTAHEIYHVMQWSERRWRDGTHRLERTADSAMMRVLESFRANRAELESEWMREPERVAAFRAPSKSIVEKRAEHARKMLATWEKKQATAKKRVVAWRKKVKYYEDKGH